MVVFSVAKPDKFRDNPALSGSRINNCLRCIKNIHRESVVSRKNITAKQSQALRQSANTKSPAKSSAKLSPAEVAAQKRKDDAMASIISGLNVLIAQASGADMGMASRILYTAKEELVHWAVDMNFHECSKDRYVNRHLYESGLHAIGEFIAVSAK